MPEEKYIIQHRDLSHVPARNILPVHLTRHFHLRQTAIRSLLLAVSPERSKDTYEEIHVNHLPLLEMPRHQ